jgi:cyclopropane-fatty-acyl-phospholipid synthase
MSFLQSHPANGSASSSLTSIITSLLIPTSYSNVRPHHLLILYTTTKLLSSSSSQLVVKYQKKLLRYLSLLSDLALPLIYSGLVPDSLIRLGIRIRLSDHLNILETASIEDDLKKKLSIIDELKTMPIAIATDEANEQHYEVPAAFYDMCLGPRKKYSSGLWEGANCTFEESEVAMLELYCVRAGVKDGMKIVDLGCGWGSLTLYLAEKYPNAKITSISNSHSQREYILRTAEQRGLKVGNINVITCNVNDDQGALDVVRDNDLVISIEMFEHMKNYSILLNKVNSFLSPEGKLFLHIFTHKTYTYHFDSGWLADNFFTGGTMPSDDLLLYFQEHFLIENHWRVNGQNYEKTSNGWLALMDDNWKRGKLAPVLKEAYGAGKEREWYVNWRLFFLACAELWGYDQGTEWIVSHYLFEKRG